MLWFRAPACTAHARALVAVAVFSLMLQACGYRPLYATAQPAAPGLGVDLSSISISPIPDRVGHVVYRSLQDRLTPTGEPQRPLYRLEVSLQEVREGLAIEQDESVTRFNYRLIGTFALRDANTGELLHTGRARTIAAYNVVQSDFATLSAERDAEDRAARELSELIRIRLAIYFDRAAG